MHHEPASLRLTPVFLAVAAVGLLWWPAPAGAQTPATPCEAPPEVTQALSNLPRDAAERQTALRALLEQRPDDLFVHRRYLTEFRLPPAGDAQAGVAEYRALLEKHPEHPLYTYLSATSLIGTDTKQALSLLDKVLERSPNFQWAHLRLVEIHASPNFRDPAKLRQHLATFMNLCPSSLQGFAYVRNLGPADSEFVSESARRLRVMLQDKTDREFVYAYPTLWGLEFRARPTSEHPELRKQVAEDLKRLRAAAPERNKEYAYVFVEGYKLADDPENRKWAEDLLAKQSPSTGAMAAYREWNEKNPYPKPEAPDKYRDRSASLLKATEDWVRQWPNESFVWEQRLQALRTADGATPQEVEAAADALLRLREGNAVRQASAPATLTIAEVFQARGVRLDRLPALLEEAIRELSAVKPATPTSDLYIRVEPSSPLSTRDWYSWQQAADLALRINDRPKAHVALDHMQALMEKQRPPEKSDPADSSAADRQRTANSMQISLYWERVARLAELEDRKKDALAAYESSLKTRPRSPYAYSMTNDSGTERARMLWYQSGGDFDGWRQWIARVEAAAPPPLDRTAMTSLAWAKVEKKLPAFELADMQGKKWRLDDLKGKVALINLWATWCGSCREELPHFQKLYDRMKDRTDVMLLTISLDDDPGLIEPFLKEHKFTFPAIAAKSYIDGIDPMLSIPRNWLVARDGVVRNEQVGFSPGNANWIDQMVEAIEKGK